MRREPWWFLSILSLSAILIGCGSDSVDTSGIGVQDGDLPSNVHVLSCNGSLMSGVAIYYDATPNMAGFLHDGGYEELVTYELDSAIPSGTSVRSYRVATRLENGMSEIESHREPSRSEFYALGDTELANVVDTASVDELSVVVTNLFQTDADINRVSRAISEKFFADSLAVGVAAARYKFRGTMYDIGLQYGTQSYEGPRPLYIMALGDHCAVADYFSRLEDSLPGDTHYLIFSPYLVGRAISFASIDATENIFQDRLPGLPRDEFTRQFSVHDSNKPAAFSASLEVANAPFSIVSELQNLDLAVSCERATGGSCSSQELSALSPQVIGSNGGALRVEIESGDLQSTVYRYDINFLTGTLSLPDWVSDWNIDIAEIEPGQFPGEKTQNLHRFMRQIRNDVEERFNPQPGHLRIYVNNDG